VLLWRLELVARVLLLGAVPLAVAVVWAASAGAAVVSGLVVVLVATLAAVTWWVPAQRYRCWRYAVRDDVLDLRHGWLWQQRSLVPHYRVQHIDIEQGPLERRLGLAKLELHTASAASDASLPGIEVDVAEEIRAHVLARAAIGDGGDAV
jgi:membrane protein YdbS with pleckstrin-like domain